MAEQVAKQNLDIKNLNKKEKKYNYKVLEKIYKKKKIDAELIKIKDSLIILSSSSFSSGLLNSLGKFEISLRMAESTRLINDNKLKHNKQLFIAIILSVIFLFSFLFIKSNYNLQLEQNKTLELSNYKYKNEVEKKNRELTSKVNFILQRNEYLKKIQSKLESSKSTDHNLKSVSYNLNSLINSEKSYKEFENMFVNVYPEFYKKLNEYASLTNNDLRLAAFIKMNHSNNEIAIISGVSIRTIETQRYRLSKKLNLKKDQSLNSFLLSI